LNSESEGRNRESKLERKKLNSKLETLNSKQIQNPKFKTGLWTFSILSFEFI
jgi:hypothetical protein